MKNPITNRPWDSARRSRRRGSVLVYVALMMPVFMGVAAMAVDMSFLYNQRALAQRAADAAALAGAECAINATSSFCTANGGPAGAILTIAKANGFDPSTNTKVTVTDNCTISGCTAAPRRDTLTGSVTGAKVYIDVTEPSFFAGYLGVTSNKIEAHALAQYTGIHPIPISPQQYGLSTSADYNYSLFGPYAYYSYGDYTATKYYDGTGGFANGTLNTNYLPGGINYTVTRPTSLYQTTYGTNSLVIQIFDPTTTDNGVDEIRAPNVTDSGYNGNEYTNTQYSLIWDIDGNAANTNPADHVTISTQDYADDPTYADKWVTPPGFTVDLSTYNSGNFHVNVTALNGSSENGFSLRAGPPAGDNTVMDTAGDTTWTNTYQNDGTAVQADSLLPVNFNVNGTATIELGVFPKPSLVSNAANAGTITVTKFDTDVGATGITYQMEDSNHNVIASYGTNYTYQGSSISLNNGNGVFSTDTIVLPPSFPGGTLYVNYSAGASDTSEWSMAYSGDLSNGGSISLVE